MATEKQITANRQNALKSRGPTSVLGKMVSSRNSTSHGFYATDVVLPDEDRDEFYRFARRLITDYNPIDPREAELMKAIIETHWQLRRINQVETELYQIYSFYEGNKCRVGTAFAHDAVSPTLFPSACDTTVFFGKNSKVRKKLLQALRRAPA